MRHMDKKYPFISVIIPVYNAGKFLRDCFDSILNQENQDFEVIVVDDGSTDNSPEICDIYAQNDSRFRIIHKKNEGVSIARNIALEMAQGQFVAFIDSDDSISSDFLTIPSKLNSVDVIQKSYKCIGFAGREVKVSVHNHLYDKWDKIAFLWVNKPNRALWDKIIAKKVIGNHRFIPGISISEDFLFFTSILHNIHTYAMCNIGHYNYFIRKSSAMSVFYTNPHERIRITFEHIQIVAFFVKNERLYGGCKGLIYGFLVYSLWEHRSNLSKGEYRVLSDLLQKMKLSDLKYLRCRWKIEMLIVRIKNMLLINA